MDHAHPCCSLTVALAQRPARAAMEAALSRYFCSARRRSLPSPKIVTNFINCTLFSSPRAWFRFSDFVFGLLETSGSQGVTDSTIVPPPKKKTAIVFNDERFLTARHEEGCRWNVVFTYFLVCIEGLSNDGVGVTGGTVLQQVRPGTGFKNGDFAEENLEGLP